MTQKIAFIGLGNMGEPMVRVLLKEGFAVTVVPHRRREPAERLGIAYASGPPDDADSDLVFHASGSPGGLVDALKAAGPEARVVELSWFGDAPVELPLGQGFHSRRLTLRSSQVGAVPPSRRARWSRKRRLEVALELLRDERLDTLISGESPFEDLPEVLARLSKDGSDCLCHRIRYAPTT